jgi:hypothetical protein
MKETRKAVVLVVTKGEDACSYDCPYLDEYLCWLSGHDKPDDLKSGLINGDYDCYRTKKCKAATEKA